VTPAGLEQLIRERIGLDVASLGASALTRALQRRMAARDLPSEEAYAKLVSGDSPEWSALVGELVVPESWFFRGGVEFFEHLARWIRNRLAESPNGKTVRVLSVPCGTGEEPYSLALALAQEGIPGSRCQIDGVDLARDHLLRAVAGRYSAFSFRETFDPRPKCFHELDDGKWELLPEYRDRVHFRPGNLVDPHFLLAEPPYDVILCRNLFIYLTADGRSRALANLDRLLAPNGRLCLTPSEADRLPAGKFVADGSISLAVFQRNTKNGSGPRSDIYRIAPGTPSRASQPKAASRSSVSTRPSSVRSPYSHVPLRDSMPSDPLGEGRRLADAGNLDAARAICLESMAAEAPTANLFSLLGVIHLAAGRPDDATDAFRKALYLEPDHAEALMHMIGLCERRGDPDQAAGLRRRLKRTEHGAVS
jgi:chemotaxis protein methyltransferase WspC